MCREHPHWNSALSPVLKSVITEGNNSEFEALKQELEEGTADDIRNAKEFTLLQLTLAPPSEASFERCCHRYAIEKMRSHET